MASKTKKQSFQTYLAFIIRHPFLSLTIAAVITVLLAWQLPALSFKTTVYDLIIEELPQARSYRDFTDTFGSDEIIRIVVKADNVFDPATFAKVTQLSEAAGNIEGVRRILSLPEVKKQVDPRNEWKTGNARQLEVPGEKLLKVFTRLIDPGEHTNKDILRLKNPYLLLL